jgi:hypothetical protein
MAPPLRVDFTKTTYRVATRAVAARVVRAATRSPGVSRLLAARLPGAEQSRSDTGAL